MGDEGQLDCVTPGPGERGREGEKRASGLQFASRGGGGSLSQELVAGAISLLDSGGWVVTALFLTSPLDAGATAS